MIILRRGGIPQQKSFGKVKEANKALKKALENKEAFNLRNRYLTAFGEDLSPSEARSLVRLGKVSMATRGNSVLFDKGKRRVLTSTAELNDINRKINTNAMTKISDQPRGPIKYGDRATTMDWSRSGNGHRWETLRGVPTKPKK